MAKKTTNKKANQSSKKVSANEVRAGKDDRVGGVRAAGRGYE